MALGTLGRLNEARVEVEAMEAHLLSSRQARNRVIREAHIEGMTVAEISRAVRLSHPAVLQILGALHRPRKRRASTDNG
jgi:hypothetical protein